MSSKQIVNRVKNVPTNSFFGELYKSRSPDDLPGAAFIFENIGMIGNYGFIGIFFCYENKRVTAMYSKVDARQFAC